MIPRSFSSGARSISSKAMKSANCLYDSTFVIAAVSVVLPWSTWPDRAYVYVRLGSFEVLACHSLLCSCAVGGYETGVSSPSAAPARWVTA